MTDDGYKESGGRGQRLRLEKKCEHTAFVKGIADSLMLIVFIQSFFLKVLQLIQGRKKQKVGSGQQSYFQLNICLALFGRGSYIFISLG